MIDLPIWKEAIGLRWFNFDDSLLKYKVHLFAKGYAQIPSIDFSKKNSSIAKIDTIIIVLALVAKKNIDLLIWC